MKKLTVITSAILLSAASFSNAQTFAPSAGQWELGVNASDLFFSNTSSTVDGSDVGKDRTYTINADVRRQISESLNVGVYVRGFSEESFSGAGDSIGGIRSATIRPSVELLLTENIGIAATVRYQVNTGFDGDGDTTGSRSFFTLTPRAFYRTAIAENTRLDAYGQYSLYTRRDFNADGDEVAGSEYGQNWLTVGALVKHYLAPNFSANADFNFNLGNYNTQLDDDIERKFTDVVAEVGFSFYF